MSREQEAHEIGVEAYHYLYPLVMMEVTRRVMTNLPAGVKEGMGPMNAFHHMRSYPPAGFREVVRPNFDTLYSMAWLDLSRGPVVVSAEDTGGRYYMLPMLDLWSDVFAVPGKRTSGTAAGRWAVVPPGWSGSLPEGVSRIDSPTTFVWIIGRTQTNGPADYDAVHRVQAGYVVTPLSLWGKGAEPAQGATDPSVDMRPPMVQVDTMTAAPFFTLGAELMKANPPHATDWSQVARLARIGIVPGKGFDFARLEPAVQAALERAVPDAMALMKAKVKTMARIANGWVLNTDSIGAYGNYYLKRAVVAMIGLGANQPEDAIYPLCLGDADGKPLEGSRKYVLRFGKDELPPVGAFWSVTMYDAEGYHVANPLDRFAIGDRDPLRYNADGSLDLHIQASSPGPDREANWLPSPPSGVLGVTMRLYAPKAPILDGRWVPPPIRCVG